jgi:hypothetical protein
MKKLIAEIYKIDPPLVVDIFYVLNTKINSQANVIKKQMIEAIHDITGISIRPQKIVIKKTGNKEIYTFTEDDTIFRIIGQNGNWTFLVAIPHVGAKGFDDVSIHESAGFIKTGKSKSLEQIISFFRKALGQAVSFLRIRKFAFDNKGNILSTVNHP